MPTPEEARDGYGAAQRKKRVAEKSCDEKKRERAGVQDKLTRAKTEKINLECRKEDLGKILRRLEGETEDRLNNTNKRANNAEGEYSKAVSCIGVASSSIAEAFFTPGVQADVDTKLAYDTCSKELTRVGNEIEALKTEIRILDSKVSGLTADIEMRQRVITNAVNDMNYFRRFM